MVKGTAIAVPLAVPLETLGSSPVSVEPGCNWEVHGATHNCPSIVRVRESLAGKDILVSSRTSHSFGGLGAVHTNQAARCMVFPLAGFRVG